MTPVEFYIACRNPGLNCVGAVREVLAHDRRVYDALREPDDQSPANLLAFAARRAAAAGIPERNPKPSEPAVGFLQCMGVVACAVHLPDCGWWCKGRHGMRPVAPRHIVKSYEVAEWPRS